MIYPRPFFSILFSTLILFASSGKPAAAQNASSAAANLSRNNGVINSGYAAQSGRVTFSLSNRQSVFLPGPSGRSGHNFDIMVTGTGASYSFKGLVDGKGSTSILKVHFFEGQSSEADAVTFSISRAEFGCGSTSLFSCHGLTSRLSSDRTSMVFEFQDTRLKKLGQDETIEISGEVRVDFPAPLSYVRPSELPTDVTGQVTLDGQGFEALIGQKDAYLSFGASPVLDRRREFQLATDSVSLFEAAAGSFITGEVQDFYCITPAERKTPCPGFSVVTNEAERIYNFNEVVLKEYTNQGRLGPQRKAMGGQLRVPFRRADVSRVGGGERMTCPSDSCDGTNMILTPSNGKVTHQISVKKKNSDNSINEIQGVSFSYEYFNPHKKLLILGTRDGAMMMCSNQDSRPVGDCSGVQLQDDGMTVNLNNVVVNNPLNGQSWQLSGSIKAAR